LCGGMRTLASLFLLAASAMAAPDPARLLFDTGVKDVEIGRFERARLAFQTLIDTYPGNPLASDAKAQIDATKLYEEGQDRMRQGRFDAAEFTFQTLLSVYPESPLVKQAEEAMHSAAKAQAELNVRLTVRGLDLKDVGLPAGPVQKCFQEREVRLAAGKPFDPRDVEQARAAVTELLAERGIAGAQIRTEVRMAGEHQVDVVLTRVK
jgi:tetratricopeptide (TPR) repeat protein